ncbi:hypothetical protein C8R45DRAFT_923950 [Mycena sanguinolenta]|nr:hypothetical protein C8R45DRAFT_923950 [Mycena sanguinolenta]
MPRQPTITEVQLENFAACLTSAVTVLNDLNDAFSPPFVQPISETIASLINLVQNVKQNKKECVQLLENIYQVLYAVIKLHIKSDAPGSLSPAMTDHVGKFMKTLHKIYTYIEAQQDSNNIRQLFRSIEMSGLVKDCHAELDKAKEVFEVNAAASVFKNIVEMKTEAETKHKELLELISAISETNTISDGSSAHLGANELKTELNDIMKILLNQPAPRIAILGGGGMGKTSLARTVLHHPDTPTKFEQRFFVSAEPATSSIELAVLIGLHIGLDPDKDLTKAVVQYFSEGPPCLLILDNLETVWEPLQSRDTLEGFLALLTDITMRGTTRPAKVQWTHPFLLPLSDNAAQQTFMDVTDGCYSIEDFSQLLSFTDNMPLAVDLLAHLVDYEGLENVLAQWKAERTSMLSVGYDRKSNLDASISLSLSSPQVTPDSKELLSLLSILPNGLSDVELVQSQLPISNIMSCKAVLLATSLAYQSSNKRLMVLMPVREHIQQFLPPSPALVHSLFKCFYELLELYKKSNGEQIISLNYFYRTSQWGVAPVMELIQHILPGIPDHRLQIHFSIEALMSCRSYNFQLQMENLIIQGLFHLEHIEDPSLESKFYHAASSFKDYKSEFSQAQQFANKALQLAKLTGDVSQHGNYSAVQRYARDAQQLSELSMDLYQSAIALSIQAASSRQLGNYHKIIAQNLKAKAFIEICGMAGGGAGRHTILNLAEIHLVRSEYTQAQRIYRDLAGNTSPVERPYEYAIACLNIAYVDIQIGGTAENIWKNLNIASEIYKKKLAFHKALLFLGDVFMIDEDEDTALALYTVALERFRSMDVHHSRAQCMLRLGDLAQKHGNTTAAITYWKTARPLFNQSSQAKYVAEIDSRLATAEKAHEEALKHLQT